MLGKGKSVKLNQIAKDRNRDNRKKDIAVKGKIKLSKKVCIVPVHPINENIQAI